MGFFDAIVKGGMGFLTGGPVGAGLAIGGSLLQNRSQGKADKQNYQNQLAQQQYIQQMLQGGMQQGPNPYAQQISGLFGGQGLQQWGGYTPEGVQAQYASGPQLSTAPQIGIPDALSFLTVNAPGGPGNIDPSFGAQMIGAPGQVNVPLIEGPRFGSDFNMGQDSLMQMLNRSPGQQRDRAMTQNLRQLYGGDMGNVQQLIDANTANTMGQLDQQVSALRGSAGTLGQRFGSDLRGQEGQLRTQTLLGLNQLNQGALQQAFQNSQQNRLAALGLGAQNLNQANQFGLQGAQVQQGAAQQLMQAALQAAQLGQGAQFQNASNLLQAQGINVNAALQAAQANQGAGLQANSQNLQALLANQQTGVQGAQMALQAALANQQAGNQMGQFNVQQMMQAALANQQQQGQFGLQQGQFDLQTALANMQAGNQMGQFNASLGLQGAQLNAQQQNIMNQLMLSGLGQAGQLQQGQQGQNNQLLALLAGQQVPQQPAGQLGNTLGDIGQFLTVLPYLQGGQKPAAQSFQAPPTLRLPNLFK